MEQETKDVVVLFLGEYIRGSVQVLDGVDRWFCLQDGTRKETEQSERNVLPTRSTKNVGTSSFV